MRERGISVAFAFDRHFEQEGFVIGYVRTSKKEQNPDLQRREQEAVGCEHVFEESISSRKEGWPQLQAAMDYSREGDALVVWNSRTSIPSVCPASKIRLVTSRPRG